MWQSGSAAAYPLASLKARPSSWETSSMTSLGRTGNTKIAGQPGSQPRACTPDRTKVHNVFSMCLICPLTTVFSLSLSLSLSPSPFLFLHSSCSFIIPLYRQPSPSLSTFLSLSPRLCGRGGKVTRSTLGRLQCAEPLQVQGIICCFWRAAERKGGEGWWKKGGMDGYNGWMDGWIDGWMDGWASRWPGGQDEFTQSHIPHSCKIPRKWAQLADLILTWTADQRRDEWIAGNRNKHYS